MEKPSGSDLHNRTAVRGSRSKFFGFVAFMAFIAFVGFIAFIEFIVFNGLWRLGVKSLSLTFACKLDS